MKPDVHELKCWPEPFAAIRRGDKNFELRRNDRDFQVEDVLKLHEYDPETQSYSGRHLLARVNFIIRDFEHEGVAEGFVAMSIYRFREPRSI